MMGSSTAVREDRLWQRHMDMAKLAARPRAAVNRQALSPEDAAAAKPARRLAKGARLGVSPMRIGNLFRAARRHRRQGAAGDERLGT